MCIQMLAMILVPCAHVDLRHLVLVVGEHQIDAAAVDVKHLAQVLLRHGRAFEVPAWRLGRSPKGFPSPARPVGGLPQHEIHRVALVRRNLDAGAGLISSSERRDSRAVIRIGGTSNSTCPLAV